MLCLYRVSVSRPNLPIIQALVAGGINRVVHQHLADGRTLHWLLLEVIIERLGECYD